MVHGSSSSRTERSRVCCLAQWTNPRRKATRSMSENEVSAIASFDDADDLTADEMAAVFRMTNAPVGSDDVLDALNDETPGDEATFCQTMSAVSAPAVERQSI